MIMKFRNVTSSQLAALHAYANFDSNQLILQKATGWHSGSGGITQVVQDLPSSPVITVMESKHQGGQFHDVTIEVSETHWVIYHEDEAKDCFQKQTRKLQFGYKEVPVNRNIINGLFDAVGRF